MMKIEEMLDNLEKNIIKLTNAEDALVFLENNELQVEIYTVGGGYQTHIRRILHDTINYVESVIEEMWQEMKLMYNKINQMEDGKVM